MKRKQVPQISNSSWFPSYLTACVHEFMTWFVSKVNAARPFLPVIDRGLHFSRKLVVIQKSAGAGFESVDPLIDLNIPREFVSADNFNADQDGLYIMVNSFHLLNPQEAGKILREIAVGKKPVVILEGNNDSLWQVFGMLVIVPLTVILTAPFVRPFRFSRIVFSWLIPILPVVICVDGFLALFKLYAPADLDELTSGLKIPDYTWESGKLDNGRGGKIIYLLGHPGEIIN